MRDIVFTLFVAVLVVRSLAQPHIGAYSWAWISLMNAHRLMWGFATTIPFGQVIAIATMIGMLRPGKRHAFPVTAVTVLYVTFLVWMSVTSLFALNDPEIVLQRWVHIMKIHVMMFVTLMLLRERRQIETLIWVVTLSLGFYGIKGGVFTLLTGGEYRVWGPPSSFVEGNNELAVGLVMLVPFLVYLHQISSRRWLRWALLFCALMCAVSILGSHSRGALLALTAMLAFLGLKSRRPVLSVIVLAGALIAGVLFMPESWTSRMETIATYQDDSSAMSRIYVWKTLWAMALDRPLVGAGFATDSAAVFLRYAPPGFEQFAGQYWVAHSIYFQSLGEHGFPGLALFLCIGLAVFRRASKLAALAQGHADLRDWVPLLMRCTHVSLIGYAVGGSFLNLLHFDLPYYVVGYVVLVDVAVRQRERQRQQAIVSASEKPFARATGMVKP